MHRTRNLIQSASSPAALEAKILINHGSETKFSFLRSKGRWHDIWLGIKRGQIRKILEKDRVTVGGGTADGMALVSYGDDDDEADEQDVKFEACPVDIEGTGGGSSN